MGPVDRTADLLVRWWNFPSRTAAELALHGSSAVASSSPRADLTDDLGFPNLLEAPLPEEDMLWSSREKGNGQVVVNSLVDEWLDGEFRSEDFALFQEHLESRETHFSVTLGDSRTYTGPLAFLCSIAMTHLMVKKPNPLFFLPFKSFDAETGHPNATFFDSRWLLPTPNAREMRQALLGIRTPILSSPGQVFLFGAYLPELVGVLVVDNVPLAEAHSRVGGSRQENIQGATQNRKPSRGAPSEQPVGFPIARYILLGFAQLSKKLLGGSVRYGNWQEAFIRAVIGPRSSQGLLGRRGFRELKKVSRGDGGTVVAK